jgi:hypothetical protein
MGQNMVLISNSNIGLILLIKRPLKVSSIFLKDYSL